MSQKCCLQDCLSRKKIVAPKRFTCFAPKNVETMERWKKELPPEQEFTLKHRLCELHFEEEYIERYYTQELKDGSTFKLLRGFPKLIPEAIPTVFSSFESERRIKEIGSIYSDNASKKSKISHQDESLINQVPANIPSDNYNSVFLEENMKDDVPTHCWQFCESVYGEETPKKSTISDPEETVTSEVFDKIDFAFLKANLKDVKLPTLSWCITTVLDCGNNHVVITHWVDMQPERWLIIKDNLDVKVFLKGVPFESNLKISTLPDVDEAVKKVHFYRLCAGLTDKRMTGCQKIIGSFDKIMHGRGKKWCPACLTWRRKTAYTVQKPSK